jgi:nucleoside phosphorylase
MTGIVAGIGARAALSAAGARLGQISPRTWLVIGCAVALAVGFLWHQHAAHKHDLALIAANDAKWQPKVDALKAQLNAITTARDTQKVVTKTQIVTATKIIHDGNGKAQIVEQAPPAPNCKTKPQILGADL